MKISRCITYIPVCESKEFNYFVHTCEALDPDGRSLLAGKAAEAVRKGREEYTFIVTDQEDFDAVWTELYDQGGYKGILSEANRENCGDPEIDTDQAGVYYFKLYRVISLLFGITEEKQYAD